MIKIAIVEPTDQKWKKWLNKCRQQKSKDIQLAKAGKKIRTKDALYKEQKQFLINPDGLFNGKCAYCEAFIDRQWGQIEHYRPKAAVTNEDRKQVMITARGKRKPHPGYY